MDWSDVDLQGQRDNGILRAQIQDARNDVAEWRSIGRSNEELFYLDEMAECLGALERIVATRLTGVEPHGEEHEWETRVKWLLDAYEKIGHVRGRRFGSHLSGLISFFGGGRYNIQTKMKRPEVSQLGQNIKRFMKECGWSPDELARKTGIDRKQIFYHVQGRAKPRALTLKLYSQAFTKALGRPISPADLEKPLD